MFRANMNVRRSSNDLIKWSINILNQFQSMLGIQRVKI